MKLYYRSGNNSLYNGNSLDILEVLEPKSIDMCITSPPYWGLRTYGHEEELGHEESFKNYITNLREIFSRVYPILKDTGSLWVNIGDKYFSRTSGSGGRTDKQVTNSGSFFTPLKFKPELPDGVLCNIPARFSVAMQDDGWHLKNVVIWHKPNVYVTSAKNRFTVDFEYVFWFVKNPKGYYFEQQFEPFSTKTKWNPIRKDGDSDYDKGTGQTSHRARNMQPNSRGRNKRTVWSINVKSVYGIKHFAKFPQELVETPILATCPESGTVLDLFMGSGTTALVAQKLKRNWVGIELIEDYCKTIVERVSNATY